MLNYLGLIHELVSKQYISQKQSIILELYLNLPNKRRQHIPRWWNFNILNALSWSIYVKDIISENIIFLSSFGNPPVMLATLISHKQADLLPVVSYEKIRCRWCFSYKREVDKWGEGLSSTAAKFSNCKQCYQNSIKIYTASCLH